MNDGKFCTIYVVRHGESEANLAGLYGLDTRLTDKGRKQVKKLAGKLRGVRFDAIFSSPMVRTRETAEIIAVEHRLVVLTKETLRERFYGEMEGVAINEIRGELRELNELRERLPYEEWKSVRMVSGYESDEELMSRFITTLREIAVAYMGENVLVTNHVSTMKTFLVHLGLYERKQLGKYAFENTGYIKLESDGVDFFVLEIEGLKLRKVI